VIGRKVQINGDQAVELKATASSISKLQEELGTLREEYLAKEQRITQRLAKLRLSYHDAMLAAGKSSGIALGSDDEDWKWYPDDLVFERIR
jgi:hypothetical protein